MDGFIAKNGKENYSLKSCDVGLIPEDDLWTNIRSPGTAISLDQKLGRNQHLNRPNIGTKLIILMDEILLFTYK